MEVEAISFMKMRRWSSEHHSSHFHSHSWSRRSTRTICPTLGESMVCNSCSTRFPELLLTTSQVGSSRMLLRHSPGHIPILRSAIHGVRERKHIVWSAFRCGSTATTRQEICRRSGTSTIPGCLRLLASRASTCIKRLMFTSLERPTLHLHLKCSMGLSDNLSKYILKLASLAHRLIYIPHTGRVKATVSGRGISSSRRWCS